MNNYTDLSKYNNDWYNPGSKIKKILWYFANRIFFKTYFPFPIKFKLLILKIFGARMGDHVIIKPNINIKYPWFLEVKNYVWIGEGVWIDNLAYVFIGNNVCISQDALILTGNHNYKSNSFDLMVKEIILEDGVWIGARSVVCPGVKCGSHSILSVGSVATRDLESFGIYQGNPAKIVKKRVIC